MGLTLDVLRAELLVGDDDGEEHEHENGVLVRDAIGEAVVAPRSTEDERWQARDNADDVHLKTDTRPRLMLSYKS